MSQAGDGNLEFYRETLSELLRDRVLTTSMSLLVTCGGPRDVEVLRASGFTNVRVSNLDSFAEPADYEPFQWDCQDAERLGYADASFDFAIVHSGLHHCRVPQQALTEMARVARIGILVIEPNDNLLSRMGARLGVGQEYELAAVSFNDFKDGGVGNTEIPNLVYRLSAWDIERALKAYFAHGRPVFRFRYRMRLPWEALRGRRNKLPLVLLCAAFPALKLIEKLAPSQCNNFAAVVLRPRDLHPWVTREGDELRVDRAWLQRTYNR